MKFFARPSCSSGLTDVKSQDNIHSTCSSSWKVILHHPACNGTLGCQVAAQEQTPGISKRSIPEACRSPCLREPLITSTQPALTITLFVLRRGPILHASHMHPVPAGYIPTRQRLCRDPGISATSKWLPKCMVYLARKLYPSVSSREWYPNTQVYRRFALDINIGLFWCFE